MYVYRQGAAEWDGLRCRNHKQGMPQQFRAKLKLFVTDWNVMRIFAGAHQGNGGGRPGIVTA